MKEGYNSHACIGYQEYGYFVPQMKRLLKWFTVFANAEKLLKLCVYVRWKRGTMKVFVNPYELYSFLMGNIESDLNWSAMETEFPMLQNNESLEPFRHVVFSRVTKMLALDDYFSMTPSQSDVQNDSDDSEDAASSSDDSEDAASIDIGVSPSKLLLKVPPAVNKETMIDLCESLSSESFKNMTVTSDSRLSCPWQTKLGKKWNENYTLVSSWAPKLEVGTMSLLCTKLLNKTQSFVMCSVSFLVSSTAYLLFS